MRINIKKYLLLTAGFLFLVIGIIGIFVPVLPTAPFLLLSAFFWVRSSEKMYNWLINHKRLGPFIKDYIEKRAVKQSTKVKAISMIWISLCISMLLVKKMHISIILIAVGAALSAYLISLNTLEKEKTRP